MFAAGLAVAFGAAFGVGRAADLGMPGADRAAHGTARGTATAAATPRPTSAAGDDAPDAAATATRGTPTAAADALPGGLQVAQDGYRLVLDHPVQRPPGRRH